MKTVYRIYTPGQAEPLIQEVDWPREPGLNLIKGLIEPIVGGHLEHVNVLFNDRESDMFVHEEGRIFGLPRNDTATDIYLAAWKKKYPGLEPDKNSYIVGNTVIFDRRVWY